MKAKARVEERECYVCGERYEAKRDDSRYCSPRCRQKISRAMRLVEAVTGKQSKQRMKGGKKK